MKDMSFIKLLKGVERTAWYRYIDVTENFLGSHREPDFADRIKKMLEAFKWIGCSCSLKMHLLNAHLDRFLSNSGDYCDQQGERAHQDCAPYENRFKGHCSTRFAGELCHVLSRDTETKHNRKSIQERNNRTSK